MKRIVSIIVALAMLLSMGPMAMANQNSGGPAVDLENAYVGEVFVAVNTDPSNGAIGTGETFSTVAPVTGDPNNPSNVLPLSDEFYSDEESTYSEENDVEMHFMTYEEMQEALELAQNSAPQSYVVGSRMTRTVSDEGVPSEERTVEFECVAIGTNCTVWREVRSTPVDGLQELTNDAAQAIVAEFDGKYSDFCNLTGNVNYIDSDNDGKVAILCYDIDSTFENTPNDVFYGSYTLGYFWGADLTSRNGSALDCIHIDTFPVMAQNSNKNNQFTNVSRCFSTLFHEYQHYAWKSNRGLNSNSVRADESFYNEGLSMAVQHALYGYQNTAGRVSTFNKVQDSNPGRALKWYDAGSDDYGHAYVFSQYLRTRYAQMVNDRTDGNSLFKLLYQKVSDGTNNDDFLGTYADILYPQATYPSLTTTADRIAKLLLDFWIATYVKADSGAYGFAGEEFANNININPSIEGTVPTTSANIYNGGANFYYTNSSHSGTVEVDEAASGSNMKFAAINPEGVTRDVVLLLDYSGSMNSSQIRSLKTAAKSFCEQSCDGINTKVSIVKYSTYSTVVCDLTADKNQLNTAIDGLSNYSENLTYMAEALDTADSVLANGTADKQVIILMTDGAPNGRETNTSNRYPYYPAYTAVYDTAESLINTYAQNGKDLDIYTMGFYSYSYSNSLEETLLTDIANINNNSGKYVKVTDANDLIFSFAEFGNATNSTGEKIRIVIDCPVTVKLSVNCENIVERDDDGNLVIYSNNVECLDSTDPTKTASFGTIEVTGTPSDSHVVLYVDRYNDYNLEVKGVDDGSCSINIVGSDGTRKFDNIPVQDGTAITGNLNLYDVETNNQGILLDIDSDGDGVTDSSVTSVDTLRDIFTINYYVDDQIYQTKSWKANTTIVPVDAPEKAGYTFVKWDNLPETMPNNDINVTAIYTQIQNTPTRVPSSGGGGGASVGPTTIKFDSNGGSEVKSITPTKKEVVTEPEPPTKDGYIFDGWYSDKKLTNKFEFGTKVTRSITLYAKWSEAPKVTDANSVEILLTIGKTDSIVNGEVVTNDVAPKIVNDRTMLPIRFIAEALGANVEWFGDTRTVKITAQDIEISLVIGENFAMVNGEKIDLDSPSFIENNRTYLPLRFVAENLGANVEWDPDTSTVYITK